MQVKRYRDKSKRGHPVLAGMLILLLMLGLSYGGATVWQRLQEDAQPQPVESQAPEESEPLSEEPLNDPPAQPVSADPAEAQGSAEVPQVGALQGSPGGNPLADPPDEPDDAPSDYSVDWQVPASAEVPLSYFDDAVFFGDSVSTGISGYHIVDNAACYAAIGVSPHTALTGLYIGPTVDSKKTLLEAAQESGDRAKVYIMLGGNGLWMEEDAFIEDYQRFLDAVREQYPEAVIYIQSMTPVAAHVGQTYTEISKQKVIAYNKAIAELARKNNFPFLNVFEALMDENGELPAEVSPDGLHLSPEYYHKWFSYLRTHTVEE